VTKKRITSQKRDVLDVKGEKNGTHGWALLYTICQRHGFTIAKNIFLLARGYKLLSFMTKTSVWAAVQLYKGSSCGIVKLITCGVEKWHLTRLITCGDYNIIY
jgi:hypothetical protein